MTRLKTAILEMDATPDAYAWRDGCKALGMDVAPQVITRRPSAEQLTAFVASSPDWVFLSGHTADSPIVASTEGFALWFEEERVQFRVTTGGDPVTIPYSSGERYGLSRQCRLVIWTGCSLFKPAHAAETLRVVRRAFGNPVILGYSQQAGVEMSVAMLAGRATGKAGQPSYARPEHSFFHHVEQGISDATVLRQAWMETGRYHYGGVPFETRIRALDPDGQEWLIRNKTIEKGKRRA